MNEYQYYEFVALDQPLSSTAMAELRQVSARAEITSTRFRNEYRWGDLKADPIALLARYFDVHVYFANWGSRRLIFRLPVRAVNIGLLRAYFPGDTAALTVTGRYAIVDLRSDACEPSDAWYDGARVTAALTPLRSMLLRGDRRVAYLAWLLAVQAGEVDLDATEPLAVAGLAEVGAAALDALIRFLRLDPRLLAAAAESGGDEDALDPLRFAEWVESRPLWQRDGWLLRAAANPELALGAEMLSEFRGADPGAPGARRTVRQLISRAQELTAGRQRAFHR